MKEETTNQKIIEQILTILRKYSVDPKTVRYIFKIVRQRGKYQVPNKIRKLPQYFTPAEIYQILDKEKNTFDLLFYKFGCTTGLRIGEICNLQDHMVNFDSNQIRIDASLIGNKSKRDREVPMTPQLAQLLKMHFQTKKGNYVFGKSNGTRYTTWALEKRFKNMILRHGMDKKKAHPHVMRHTYATSLRAKGMQIQDIQLLLGHASVKTTEIYAHLELGPVKERFIELMADY